MALLSFMWMALVSSIYMGSVLFLLADEANLGPLSTSNEYN